MALKSLNRDGSVDNSVIPGYGIPLDYQSPMQKLGLALSGIAAPYLGDNDWLSKQQAIRSRDLQTDMEFRAKIAQQKFQKELQSNAQKSVYTMDQSGNLIPVGIIPKASQVVPNPNAPTADMRNQLVTTEQARNLWNEVKSQSEGLKGGYEGLLKQGEAFITRGRGDSGNYSLYTENLPSSAVALYRALTGDTRLSDADAKARALPLLWEPSQDVQLREKKNAFIDKMIMSREKLLSSGRYKDGVIPLSDLKLAAKDNNFLSINKDDPRYQKALEAGYKPEEIDAYFKGKK